MRLPSTILEYKLFVFDGNYEPFRFIPYSQEGYYVVLVAHVIRKLDTQVLVGVCLMQFSEGHQWGHWKDMWNYGVDLEADPVVIDIPFHL